MTSFQCSLLLQVPRRVQAVPVTQLVHDVENEMGSSARRHLGRRIEFGPFLGV